MMYIYQLPVSTDDNLRFHVVGKCFLKKKKKKKKSERKYQSDQEKNVKEIKSDFLKRLFAEMLHPRFIETLCRARLDSTLGS